jgi:hypothetical protein
MYVKKVQLTAAGAGLPDFSKSKHTTTGRNKTKIPQIIPNGHKLYQMAGKYSKRP